MGLLDDAIREHLELKRRRGGDPAEIARAEQEALGPVRREAAPAAEELHGDPADHGAHDGPAVAHADAPAPAHDFDDEPSRPPAPPEEQTRILAPEERSPAPTAHDDAHRHVPEQHLAAPADKLPPGADTFDEPPHRPAVPEQHLAAPADRVPPQEEPPAPAEQSDPRRSEIVDQPTTEYRVEDHHDEPPATGSDEDVLEETPDFLQETPEHDRLWFEQRPPRDFDFDD
jgi:hypothetical protein